MNATKPLVLYYRNYCHLCEELAALLFQRWPAEAERIEWRDVDQSAEWRAAYGHLVPVLMAGTEVLCTLRPDRERLAQYFSGGVNPV